MTRIYCKMTERLRTLLKSQKMDWFLPELLTQVRKCPFSTFAHYSDWQSFKRSALHAQHTLYARTNTDVIRSPHGLCARWPTICGAILYLHTKRLEHLSPERIGHGWYMCRDHYTRFFGSLSRARFSILTSTIASYVTERYGWHLRQSNPFINSQCIALNNFLTEFYSKYGTVIAAGEWMEKNDYSEAFDDSTEDWMRQ
jgi:hypothetical protein